MSDTCKFYHWPTGWMEVRLINSLPCDKCTTLAGLTPRGRYMPVSVLISQIFFFNLFFTHLEEAWLWSEDNHSIWGRGFLGLVTMPWLTSQLCQWRENRPNCVSWTLRCEYSFDLLKVPVVQNICSKRLLWTLVDLLSAIVCLPIAFYVRCQTTRT